MSISECRRQHDAIVRVATHLNVQAARLEHDGEAVAASRTLRTLSALMDRHLTEEMGVVYPALMDSPCADDVAAARQAMDSLDGLRSAWAQYVAFWTHERIASQPAHFAQITQAMLADLIDQVRLENDDVYPRLEAGPAIQPVAMRAYG